MVSRTLASLDAWLIQAEKVLEEQTEYTEQRSEPNATTHGEPVQLSFDLGDV